MDWRKKIAFTAQLKPMAMNRFECRLQEVPQRPAATSYPITQDNATFSNDLVDIQFDPASGLVRSLNYDGKEVLTDNSFLPYLFKDNADPWSVSSTSYNDRDTSFTLLDPSEAARFAGVLVDELAPLRVIETGPARTVIEAVFGYRESRLLQRFIIPAAGSEIDIQVQVDWRERDRFLKWQLTPSDARWTAQLQEVFGSEAMRRDGTENVMQQWLLVNNNANTGFVLTNDRVYGCHSQDNQLYISLLRSGAYAAHPVNDREIVPNDRHVNRFDQGTHHFNFRLHLGPIDDLHQQADRLAAVLNQPPMILNYYPEQAGERPVDGITLSDAACQIASWKQADDGHGWILRLFNPTNETITTTADLPFWNTNHSFTLGPYAVETFRLVENAEPMPVTMLEQPLPKA